MPTLNANVNTKLKTQLITHPKSQYRAQLKLRLWGPFLCSLLAKIYFKNIGIGVTLELLIEYKTRRIKF